jgi:hypothetical protein
MAPLIFLLVLSVFTKGAVEACCHHPCPKNAPKPWSDCTISLGFDKPPDTCEYNEHCQICDGVKVCDNITTAKCEVRNGGFQGKWAIAVKAIAPCKPCEKNPNKPCPAIHRPVCGSNGKTYPNECVAKADCEFDFTKGECSCEKGSGEPKPCPEMYDPVCGSNGKTYGNKCEAEADCQKWTEGECECKKGRPKPCIEIYAPVCGSNGKTYGNACKAEADCQKWTEGPCSCEKNPDKPCPRIYRPVCGSNGKTYPNECVAKADCEFEFTKGECSCEKGSGEPKPCLQINDPVCGSNGKTYPNECVAEADCQLEWTRGKCSYCKDKAGKCNRKKCSKRKVFAKSCQATCAEHCLNDGQNKKCPKDKKKCSPRKGKPLDCTNKKTKKSCPVSCPVCVPPYFNCFTKEVWSEEKVEWCCDNMQLGCPADSPQSN